MPSRRVPAYYALILRSLTVLEGMALSADPDYRLLGRAYPYIARRLLTDPAPQLRRATPLNACVVSRTLSAAGGDALAAAAMLRWPTCVACHAAYMSDSQNVSGRSSWHALKFATVADGRDVQFPSRGPTIQAPALQPSRSSLEELVLWRGQLRWSRPGEPAARVRQVARALRSDASAWLLGEWVMSDAGAAVRGPLVSWRPSA